MKAQHISKDPRSVSRYLLSQIGLDEQVVRKNQHNETRMLEWRDVMRLAAVDEESIISKRSPIEFGQHTDRSAEAAIFRLFIEGHDDSGLTPIPKAAELKRISASKLQLLDEVIARLEGDIAGSPEPTNFAINSLDSMTQSAKAVQPSRKSVHVETLRCFDVPRTRMFSPNSANGSTNSALSQRFVLLRAQYESDLARLEMLAQAADSLLNDAEGACPVCGAEPSPPTLARLDPKALAARPSSFHSVRAVQDRGATARPAANDRGGRR